MPKEFPFPYPLLDEFGRYKIRGLLGQGGMGAVYLAYDRQRNREVALKTPRSDLIADPVVLRRFIRESQTALRIRHPNFRPIYDAGEIHGTHYITMALIEGRSLAQWMAERTVEPAEAAQVVRKIARALDTIHAAGMVHRDVEPSNITIDRFGEPILMEFGLARLISCAVNPGRSDCRDARPAPKDRSVRTSNSVLGTPAYMSPEQVSGRVVDARSDIYNLGVTLYQLLTGRLPFEGPPLELLEDIATSNPPGPRHYRPDLDAELDAVCVKAMAKKPDSRYRSAGNLADDLERYLRSSSSECEGRTAAVPG